MSFIEYLTDNGIVDSNDGDTIRERAQSEEVHLDEVLAEHGVSEEKILSAKSDYYEIPSRTVQENQIDKDALEYISEESAAYYQIVPLEVKDGMLYVGIVNPNSIEVRDALNFISSKINLPYKLYVITKQDFDKVMERYGGLTGKVGEALSEIGSDFPGQKEKEEEGAATEDKTGELSEKGDIGEQDTAAEEGGTIVEDAPVTKIVATILRYAADGNASDIHIEHMQDSVRVRFRVDGILNTSLVLPTKVHAAVVARIKILSSMRLDEKRKPQDGRFSAKIEGKRIDFRVSTFPAYYGEKVVMRLLDQEEGLKKLEELGISEWNRDKIEKALEAPYGMILISGPTGSGKTTTLYSMLDRIDKEKNNVLSLEDPVEYNLEGVSQSQVKPEIGYTFANGLRSALRQDPDVILVGEIRDEETASLAIHAALTGHLVLSTIHTNNAVGIIPRLVDMGIDPYLIAPTLILAIAQRLVRTLCEGAGKPKPIEGSIERMIEDQFNDLPETYRKGITIPDHVYEPQATDGCPTGLSGRTAVFELLEVNDKIERVVLDGADEGEITDAARANGMLTMKEDALLKAFNGEVPFEEVGKL